MIRRTTAVMAALTAWAVTGCSSSAPEDVTVRGTMTLRTSSVVIAGADCVGTGGYRDIRAGAQVTVTGASGEVVGVGKLRDVEVLDWRTCRWSFEVPARGGEDFYGVEVSHRGVMRYPADELDGIALTLG